MKLQGLHVLILGLGESGLAMARWCLRQGARVRVADTRVTPPPPGLAQLQQEALSAGWGDAVEFIAGAFDKRLLTDIDVLALSPGLSPGQMVVFEARARGIRVTGEIELFIDALRMLGVRHQCRIIAITGTNGKTTTATLTAHLCRAAGRDTELAGNISPAALTALMARLDAGRLPEIWVLELSSFQLETLPTLAADVATVLNISSDHLDRYINLEEYGSVKTNIFAGEGVQVLNRDDARVKRMALAGRWLLSFGLDAPGMLEDFGLRERAGEAWLVQGDSFLLPLSRLPLPGMHNAANALAALALCHALNLPMPRLLDGLLNFKGLPHRVEFVTRIHDVAYYDDSKGTNVGATVAALSGQLHQPGGRTVLIAGGEGKGQDFAPLSAAVAQHARAVLLLGRDAQLLAAALQPSGVSLQHVADMDAAVRAAAAVAQPGDAVLLSPACASFDMYRNYVQRAEVFIAAVHALAAAGEQR